LALVLSLAGAALLTHMVNQPIRQLWLAAGHIDDGDYHSSYLDETASTNEVREINIGFNRMASRLAKIDQDRVVMLAGISHDLRTPLARMRLETELYVNDESARAHMANDIEQLDRTIDKFMEYARPVTNNLENLPLLPVIEGCLYALSGLADLTVSVDIGPDLRVYGDETELTRIFNNLLENARRYGKSADTGVASVEISARKRDQWVVVRVRDRGPGVAPDILPNLTKAFFRGDTARTSATGAGLGLSIVEKSIQRMGGAVNLTSPSSGGLAVVLRLNKAS
jgi:two-component system osmolarity sensor histidine kinase EnvZ